MLPNPPKAQQFDLYKYMRMIWRRKWLLILPLTICVPIAVAIACYYPTEYESTAILELQADRPQVEGGLPYGLNANAELATMRTRMLSWQSIRDMVVAHHVDLGRDVDPDDRREVERVQFDIQRRLRVGAPGPRHIAVTYRSTSSSQNASIVNELVKQFVGDEKRAQQEQAKQDLKYYKEKYAGTQARLAEIDSQIREFLQANPWLREAVADINTEYKEYEGKLNETVGEIGEYEAELAKRKKDREKEKPEIEVVKMIAPPPELAEAQRMRDGADAYFKQIKTQYQPAHPRYQDARRKYNEAMAYCAKVEKEKGGGPSREKGVEPNPAYVAIDREAKQLEKVIEKQNQRKLALDKRVNELYVLVRRAPELLAQRRKLDEERGIAAGSSEEFSSLVRRAERDFSRLQTEAYSSKFKVVEYARESSRPVKSTKFKIVLMGVMLGLLTGAALVALLEYLDQTFKTIDDAREYLNIPALGVIPAIYTPRDHRRRLWFRLLAVSSAVFVLGVGVAIYFNIPQVKDFMTQTAWVQFREWMEYM